MKLRLALFIFCSLLSLNCTSENPIQYEGSVLPVITGMWLTREDGVGTVAWGEPSYPNPDASSPIRPPGVRGFHVSNAYPNPAAPFLRFRVDIPESGALKIWATPAKLLGELDPTSTVGSLHLSTSSNANITIKDVSLYNAGNHEFIWEIERSHIPAGFYRIYFQFNDRLIARDVFVYSETDLGPPSLQKLFLP